MFLIFIQARMSSGRLPGKVLLPLSGTPIIKALYERVACVAAERNIVVLTSLDPSDDVLVEYLKREGIQFFRGSLDNVFQRFQEALKFFDCDYFVRLCADSPFLDHNLLGYMLSIARQNKYDFITNVSTRTFPKGQSVEIMRSSLFLSIDNKCLSGEEQEHVFPFFYKNKSHYQCVFVESKVNFGHINQCVDTIEDLRRLSGQSTSYKFDESEVCLHH